ncbi:hypothetical protein PGQ11_013560 [Apiospora arundinis]|uniref:Transcription factor domain-containing protein n=1 Tax=Apiospora arundinis TaxID=335852 RepID=A0ABR2HPQ2_9PEZI
MPELIWVSVGPYGKPRESDRKLIRSYCMRERNRRIGVGREKGQHARTGRGHAAIAPKPKHPAPDSQGREARHPPSGQTRPRKPPTGTEERIQGPPCHVQQPSALKAVSALFAYEIDGAALELLQRFLVAFNKTVTYRFNGAVSFEPHQTVNTAWLLEDEAYLHSVLLVASAMWQGSGNTFSSLQGNTQTGYYMTKTLASLQQGLSSSTTPATSSSSRRNVFLGDSRISVVATLAILSTNVGDMRALRAHIAGLVQMVRLRGGMRNILVQSPMLHAKIRRVDVLWSLYSGEAPLFLPTIGPYHNHQQCHPMPSYRPLPDNLSRQHDAVVNHSQSALMPLFGFTTFGPAFAPAVEEQQPSSGCPLKAVSSAAATNKCPVQRLVGSGDTRLLAVFGASRKISQQLNAALAAGRPLTEAEFAASAAEAQGALVALRGQCATIPAECLRLALLVLLTTTMGLPASSPTTSGDDNNAETNETKNQQPSSPSPPQRYPDLARKFEACIRSLEISRPPSSSSSLPVEEETTAAAIHKNGTPDEEEEEDQDQDQAEFEADFMLWLLLVGAVSLYGVHRAWLRDLWRCHVLPRGLTRWEQVARRLRRRWVWMDAVHDRLGRHAFEVMSFGQAGDEVDEEVQHSEVVDGPKNILWASGWAICPFRL